MGNKLSATDKEQIRQAFDHLDKDKSGTLTIPELKDALNVSTHEAKALVASIDTDNDGLISFEEFCKVVEKKFLAAFHNIDKGDHSGLFTKAELKKAYDKAGVEISEKKNRGVF